MLKTNPLLINLNPPSRNPGSAPGNRGCPQEKLSPGKIVFGVVPSKNDNRCPRRIINSSSLYVCLLYLPLCRARCLSFRLKQPDGYRVGKELVILLFVCVVGKMFCCVSCIFFPTWCLCWDFEFNCIDSWSLALFLLHM